VDDHGRDPDRLHHRDHRLRGLAGQRGLLRVAAGPGPRKFLPETKGLPVEEIVRVFERQQKESVLPGGSEQAA